MTGYRISGLPLADFQPLFGLDEAALKERGAIRMVADKKPGFPCRVTLRDAEPGETLILVNYEHQGAATPFRSRHAVFAREKANTETVFENEVPPLLYVRLLSVRAFNEEGMMVDADCIEGSELEPLIQRMFADPDIAYLHVHSAKPGCFVARIDRAAPEQ
ncbi:DUF1203 domain-containing protein [Allosphingosinicella flava]|uniref:DUF1203 domain-containing protein n=1 Tax=Allosphingosinicella flava TaxID=2771430 RepID=A0A7T2GJX9_9SPHN|nr:DUF1203 domain-containing protein [Sphingosinicella flava]QPQ55245.1 DUF1203 domain-containing protein [Sphingosinicella flava]